MNIRNPKNAYFFTYLLKSEVRDGGTGGARWKKKRLPPWVLSPVVWTGSSQSQQPGTHSSSPTWVTDWSPCSILGCSPRHVNWELDQKWSKRNSGTHHMRCRSHMREAHPPAPQCQAENTCIFEVARSFCVGWYFYNKPIPMCLPVHSVAWCHLYEKTGEETDFK